jgi:hypothetical protein
MSPVAQSIVIREPAVDRQRQISAIFCLSIAGSSSAQTLKKKTMKRKKTYILPIQKTCAISAVDLVLAMKNREHPVTRRSAAETKKKSKHGEYLQIAKLGRDESYIPIPIVGLATEGRDSPLALGIKLSDARTLKERVNVNNGRLRTKMSTPMWLLEITPPDHTTYQWTIPAVDHLHFDGVQRPFAAISTAILKLILRTNWRRNWIVVNTTGGPESRSLWHHMHSAHII